MKKGIIGRKLGMTQLFDEKGKVIPVTVISAGPCVVVQKRTNEKNGYEVIVPDVPFFRDTEIIGAKKVEHNQT